MANLYEVRAPNGAFTIEVTGRVEWALSELVRAGQRGITPIDNPAPRWSAYIHKLRRQGVDIETVDERHGGPFPGRHARYLLHAKITKLEAGA